MNVFQPMGMVSSALTMSMFTTSFTPPKRSRLANSGRSSTTATSYSSCVASLAIASPTWPPPTMTSRGLAMTGSMSSSVSSSSATVRAVPRRSASAAAARARASRAVSPSVPPPLPPVSTKSFPAAVRSLPRLRMSVASATGAPARARPSSRRSRAPLLTVSAEKSARRRRPAGPPDVPLHAGIADRQAEGHDRGGLGGDQLAHESDDGFLVVVGQAARRDGEERALPIWQEIGLAGIPAWIGEVAHRDLERGREPFDQIHARVGDLACFEAADIALVDRRQIGECLLCQAAVPPEAPHPADTFGDHVARK